MPSVSQDKVIAALDAAVKGSREEFFYAFLRAYQTPEATIDRIRQGDRQRNAAASPSDVAVREKVYFRPVPEGTNLAVAVDEIRGLAALKLHKIRFILVTDFESAVGVDLKAADQLSFPFADFKIYYDFFLPLNLKYEKPAIVSEHKPDAKAYEKMKRLCDGLRALNNPEKPEDVHALNLFMGRLLFCLFAEDTGIFPEPDMMTKAACATNGDGSDLAGFFVDLFRVLDTPENSPERAEMPAFLRAFPYVNGMLFKEEARIPRFNAVTMGRLRECGRIFWNEISPEIFGSMFQSVILPADRRALGAHFTSEQNILKVLKPLFLDELAEELNWILISSAGSEKERLLSAFHEKLGRLHFLDPACGSGNFLIVAYREVRKLENRCLAELWKLWKLGGGDRPLLKASLFVKVHVDHFHGIEIQEFPADIARVSLHLMEHVMNRKMKEEFGEDFLAMQKDAGRACETIPLKYTPGIVCADALAKPWDEVVKPEELSYIFGNPPFGGAHKPEREKKKKLSEEEKKQKKELAKARREQRKAFVAVFRGEKGAGDLDYVAAWYRLAGDFMLRNPRIEAAFVSTNSVCQGQQVAPLWGPLMREGFSIGFAHQTFQWRNGAGDEAAVHCVIVGYGLQEKKKKWLYSYPDSSGSWVREACSDISPYLVKDAGSTVVKAAGRPLTGCRPMIFGNMPLDGQALIVEPDALEVFKRREPDALPWIRRLVGADQMLKGKSRYCLWLVGAPEEILRLPLVAERIERCRAMRLSSTDPGTRRYADRPSQFRDLNNPDTALVIPRHGSENRQYVPSIFVNGSDIVADSCLMIPGAGHWEFGILSSAMHMAWVRTVCGRIKSDPRYSAELCWNPFPWPEADETQKTRVEELAKAVLAVRDKHLYTCLRDMYESGKMLTDLREAHRALDLAVDALYRPEKPFKSDGERLRLLFQLYEGLVAGAKEE